MTREQQENAGLKIMFCGGSAAAALCLIAALGAAFSASPREALWWHDTLIPVIVVCLVPFFVGVFVALHAATFKD